MRAASGVLRIALGNSVLLEAGFGSSSCSENEELTADHIFMIGSITKEFTRLLGFVLEEEGAISLDDTVSPALPGVRGSIGRVTLRRHVYSVANMKDTDFWFPDSELRSFADGCRENDEYWGNPVDAGMWGESGPSWNLIGCSWPLAASRPGVYSTAGTDPLQPFTIWLLFS